MLKTRENPGIQPLDLDKFSSTLSSAHVCGEGNLRIPENESGRRGLMAHLTAQCSLCLEQTPLDRPFGYFLFYKQVVVLHFHSGAASREKNDGKVVHSSWQIH